MSKLKGLKEERNQLLNDMQKIVGKAETEKRSLSAAEETQFNKWTSRIGKIDKEIEEEKRAIEEGCKPMSKSIFLSKDDKMSNLTEYRSNDTYDIGKMIKGMVTGDWNGADLEKRAMSTTATGSLIPKELAAQVIDLARNKSIFASSGVPIVPMSTNNLVVTRLASDPVFKFKEENKPAEESSMSFDSVTLQSKTILGYAYVSLEAIRSSINLGSVIMEAFSNAIANGIDAAMLYGQSNGSGNDAFAPGGIMNDTGILTIANDSNGTLYDTLIKARGKITGKNYMPNVLAINSNTEESIALLKDSQGRYLEAPEVLKDLNKVVSNQLNYDETDGSDAIMFDNTSCLIGIQDNITLKMVESTDQCIKNGQVLFGIYAMVDCKVIKPNAICKITGM